MKKTSYIFIVLFLIFNTSVVFPIQPLLFNGAENLVINKLESFIKEKKFQADETLMYPGISAKPLKAKLTELINESGREFMEVANSSATDENYQARIKAGLERFNPYFSDLSSEDLDRIYHYYEQLIEIVGLKNPGNHLKTGVTAQALLQKNNALRVAIVIKLLKKICVLRGLFIHVPTAPSVYFNSSGHSRLLLYYYLYY